jgi:hypothetical protein
VSAHSHLIQLAVLEGRGDIAIQALTLAADRLTGTVLLCFEEYGETRWAETNFDLCIGDEYTNDLELLDHLWSGEVYESP